MKIKTRYATKLLSLLILKKLKKALYQTFNEGHFGLGFDKYTHFTSPIRRYPDLVIHRIMKSIIRNETNHICTYIYISTTSIYIYSI